ncbi:MAG: FkbM family methyltransferase [Rhodospirillales bacterium]|nr:FkbM family methyltransferase [Rhodospirillales bacterium]
MPKNPQSLEYWRRFFRDLYRARAVRSQWRLRIPLKSYFGKWRKKMDVQALEEWPGGYVVLNDEDFLYLPRNKDVLTGMRLTYPIEALPVIGKFCPPGAVAFDVGANLGEWSLLMAKSIGPSGKLYSFEPLPFLAEAIDKTLKANGFKQARVIAGAVSNKSGEATLSVDYRHTGKSRIGTLESDGETERLAVKTLTLDDFSNSENLERLDFIKIDVEGHEAAVIEGAKDVLSKFRPTLILEAGMETEDDRRNIRNILTSLEYVIVGITIDHGIVEVDWDDFLLLRGPFTDTFSNVLFVPG